jgi:hypothetical protein
MRPAVALPQRDSGTDAIERILFGRKEVEFSSASLVGIEWTTC